MDTSNSNPNILSDIVGAIKDPSQSVTDQVEQVLDEFNDPHEGMFTEKLELDPIQFFKYGAKVPFSIITAKGWMHLIMWQMGMIRGEIQHLPFIKDHRFPLAGGKAVWGEVSEAFFCPEIGCDPIYHSHKISSETRLLPLIPLTPLSLERDMWPTEGTEKIVENYLFLAPKSDFVLYERTLSSLIPKAGVGWRVSTSDYFLISEVELEEKIKKELWIGPAILGGLNCLLVKAVETKEYYLRSLVNVRESILNLNVKIA